MAGKEKEKEPTMAGVRGWGQQRHHRRGEIYAGLEEKTVDYVKEDENLN